MAFDFKRFLLGAALVAASFFVPGSGFLAGALGFSLFAGGAELARSAFTQDIESHSAGILIQSVKTTNWIPIVYGTARLAPKIVFARTRDIGTNKGANERLTLVCVFCLGNRRRIGEDQSTDFANGQIQGIRDIWFDDFHAFQDGELLPPYADSLLGVSLGSGELGGRWAGMETRLGAHSSFSILGLPLNLEAIQWLVDNHGGEWSSEHIGAGLAYAAFVLFYRQEVFPANVPNITAVIEGRKVWDPRVTGLDGFWKWSNNPALCLLDYLLDPINGGGTDARAIDGAPVGGRLGRAGILRLSEINLASFMRAADICDRASSSQEALAALKFGPRYTCDGVIDTGQGVTANIEKILFSMGGVLLWEGGQYHLKLKYHRDPPVELRLTDDNTIGEWKIGVADVTRRANVMHANYVDLMLPGSPVLKDQIQRVTFPDPESTNVWLDLDNNRLIEREIDLPLTGTNIVAVQRCSEELAAGRSLLTVHVTAFEEALQLSRLDMVPLTNATAGWIDKEFQVHGMGLNPDRTVSVMLGEFASGVPGPPPPQTGNIEPILNFSTPLYSVLGSYVQSGLEPASTYIAYNVITGEGFNAPIDFPGNVYDGHVGMAGVYHELKGELWFLGPVNDVPTINVVDARTLERLNVYTYPDYRIKGSGRVSAMLYYPPTGEIFIELGGGPDPLTPIKRLDPETGVITGAAGAGDNPNSTSIAGPTSRVNTLIWHEADDLIACIVHPREEVWYFNPLTMEGMDFQVGRLGGLITTGTFEPWATYCPLDEFLYAVPEQMHTQVVRWKPYQTILEFVRYPLGGSVPRANSVLWVPEPFDVIAVSRGYGSFVSRHWPSPGWVTLYDRVDKTELHTYEVPFHPGRMSWVETTQSIAVNQYWDSLEAARIAWIDMNAQLLSVTPPPQPF